MTDAPDEQTPEPTVHGIAESDYQAWKHHPVTKLLLRYMADFRSVLIRETTERWEAGSLILAEEHEMRARVVTLRELGELPFAAIHNFYQEGSEEEQNAA